MSRANAAVFDTIGTMARDTNQRRAIRRVFEEIEHPLSPEELLRSARAYAPNLGIATVYRTLKRFIDDGWLIPVEIPGEPARYELAGKHHHHHFYCRECGRVFEMNGCPAELSTLPPRGFVIEGHELVLYGKCAQCARGHSSREKAARDR